MDGRKKRTDFLKECIADALIRLLKNKSIEEISVDELTATASVGRATYFRNFTSKTEVLTFKLVCLWECFAEENALKERRRFAVENAEAFFTYNYGIRDLLDLLYARGLQDALYDSFCRIMLDENGRCGRGQYKEKFFVYGLFGLLDEWIQNEYKETPSEMAIIVRNIVKAADVRPTACQTI